MFINLLITLGISLGLNLMFFIFAFTLKSDVFTDITYASTFLFVTLAIIIFNESYNLMSYILLTLVFLWSIRLGSYLLIRIWKTKVDHRFDKMRNSFFKFGSFWFFQALTVWLVNIHVQVSIIINQSEFNYYSLIFVFAALLFLLYETIADIQKWNWIRRKPGHFINYGLWKKTRHPNYFGEMGFWWMILGFTLTNHYSHLKLIGLLGPAYITFTLYKFSGLPLLERQSLRMFRNQIGYMEYLKNTPTILPYIGKKGFKPQWWPRDLEKKN